MKKNSSIVWFRSVERDIISHFNKSEDKIAWYQLYMQLIHTAKYDDELPAQVFNRMVRTSDKLWNRAMGL